MADMHNYTSLISLGFFHWTSQSNFCMQTHSCKQC